MNMQQVREVAKNFGIKTSRMSKEKLIQSIQLSEGNFSCFSTAVNGECDQAGCIWRDDCFTTATKKRDS
ncbi:MAG: SAP domain-containing protein [Gammaproteobacteria bacterium]|nr:SAP domain-containing protein [Gammaproteobacteria bacterium]